VWLTIRSERWPTRSAVSPQEWDAAREELLVKEKELTRARDALAAQRRRMPRMAVEKDYRFEGPSGPASLLDLFAERRQLARPAGRHRALQGADGLGHPLVHAHR
jgi:predicted dithiol-disulfide oxidoreductase (DUF899 family)